MSSALRSALLLVAAAALASTSARADQLIVNGGFETGDFTGYTVNAGATGVSGSNGPGGFAAHGGTDYAYLGAVGSLGTISQSFNDVAGQGYTFSFYLASNGTTPAEFAASFDGTRLMDLVNPSTMPYRLYSYNVIGTGNDTITFSERNDPDYLALDDVSVSTNSAVTPEPASAVLMGTGLLGAVGVTRRRRGV